MAAPDSISDSIRPAYSGPARFGAEAARHRSPSKAALKTCVMMAGDLAAALFAFSLASIFRFDLFPSDWLHGYPGLTTGHHLPLDPGYLLFFLATLLIINRRDGLYGPLQAHASLHEQRKTVQACFGAGLLLCGSLYMFHNNTVSRGFAAWFITLTSVFLCLLRAFWRWSLYRNYDRGIDTRNVLILGANHMGNAVRKQLQRSGHLGRVFKGFIKTTENGSLVEAREFVLGDLNQLPSIARLHFVDEIIITERCDPEVVLSLVGMARQLDIEMLVVPGFYEEITPEAPVEYVGNFPVVALHRRNDRVISGLLKRAWDIALSSFLLIWLLPILLIIAVVIKLDSPGPVFYVSQRIGKKGRVFACFKFRTMVANAEQLKHKLAALNERDGLLFKIKNDPRITAAGRVLRKFSLDELPQLYNVFLGDMSLVGPRPPLASEVGQYELEHFRRLEVLPGITGLWQVRARQDPSFSRYLALDLAYVENWSFWLDLKILIKTAEVVARGTGC